MANEMARNLLTALRMHFPRGIRRRILTAFAILVAILGIASASALRAHERVHGLLEEVASAEQAVEAALRLSAAVRDQYAHQAHTVILNDRSHLDHYRHAKLEVERALATARGHVAHEEDLEALGEVERLAELLNRNFQDDILPRIPGEPAALSGPHDTALSLVEQIVVQTDSLTDRIGARVQAARVQADRAQQESWLRTVFFLVVGLGLAAAVGLYLDRSLTDPLRELEAGTMRLAKGELATRVRVNREDELGSLAQHFNLMAAELSVRQERLVQSEKLAGIGRLAAGVAHEINNPLAVILGYARLISRGTEEKAARDAKVISEEVERCQQIVSGLLELSRPPRLVCETVDLAELARGVAERFASLEGAPHGVRVEGAGSVEGDEGKLRQILANLIRNAHEASPSTVVEIEIHEADEGVRLLVRDHGSGMEHEARSRLFEPFFTTKASGTGLGLAVSAALARAHGGELTLVDSGPNGTTFELALPRHAREEAA